IDGTRFERFTVDAPNIIATVDGLLSPDGTDLNLLAKLSDLRLLTPNASGATTLNARLGGVGPDYTINAEIAMPDGTLANLNADDLSILFDGTINGADVEGALSADGRLGTNAFVLDGDVAAASGAVRLDDFALGLGPNTIDGSLARGTDGLLTGRLAVDAPNLQPLAALALQQVTGALTGTIELVPIGSSQRIAVQSNASSVGYGGVRVGGAALDVRVDDALAAPRFAGTVTAQSINAPGISLASARASLDGSSGRTNFQLSVDGVTSAAAAQIAPATINASGSFDGTQGLLTLQQFAVANSQQIAVSGGGTVSTATNALNMRVSGQAPLNIAEPFLVSRGTQVDGLARFEATIAGTTSAPLINGLLSVAGGSVTDPLANLRLTNINLLAGLNGDQISINRMNARIGETGQLTIGGSVNIAANMPADLQVGLRGVPYSDGQTFSTLLNGDLTLNGPLAGQPTLSGRIDLARTEITVPESFSASSNLLEVDHLRPDQQTSTTLQRIEQTKPAESNASGGGIALNLVVNAPSQIFVRGRGLDAELGGSLTLRGTSADVIPQGQFDLRRGRLEILGQRLDFEQGSIRLVGDLDPFLNFRVASDVGDT
ncbi:MAG: translocation/assembly module TamB domain-containing protein, partial [Ahrensia sp.]